MRYPGKAFAKLSKEDFLSGIGAIVKNRETGAYQVKRGTLLFLGKYTTIREIYPHFHLDYFKTNTREWK